MSLSSCRHSKYADSGWYPAPTSVSKPACTSAVSPPHSTTCSPKRSVSVSSSKVVSSTPARVAPERVGVGQGEVVRLARGVLGHGHEGGDARRPRCRCGAPGARGPWGPPWPRRRPAGGTICSKRMLKPWAKNRASPWRSDGRDVGLVHRRLLGVGQEHHDEVGLGRGLGHGQDAQPGLLGLGLGLRPVAQPDAHVDARLGQVQRVGVALGPVADDGDLAALDQARVGVGLVVQLGHLSLPLPGTAGDAVQRGGVVLQFGVSSGRRRAAARRCRASAVSLQRAPVARALQLRQGHQARPLELGDAEAA